MLELTALFKPLQFELCIQFIGVRLEENESTDDPRAQGRHDSKAALARFARWKLGGDQGGSGSRIGHLCW
jgi:hypothetical protein